MVKILVLAMYLFFYLTNQTLPSFTGYVYQNTLHARFQWI